MSAVLLEKLHQAERRKFARRIVNPPDFDKLSLMIANHSSPTGGLFVFAALFTLMDRLRSTLYRLPVRDMVAAAIIVLSANAIVYADERFQDWIPDVLVIPEDAEVVTDRTIGSSMRMFSISTGANVETLFADWEESLSTNGYLVTQQEKELQVRSIEFTGPNIANAKIILAPITDEGRHLIEFDATLN